MFFSVHQNYKLIIRTTQQPTEFSQTTSTKSIKLYWHLIGTQPILKMYFFKLRKDSIVDKIKKQINIFKSN